MFHARTLKFLGDLLALVSPRSELSLTGLTPPLMCRAGVDDDLEYFLKFVNLAALRRWTTPMTSPFLQTRAMVLRVTRTPSFALSGRSDMLKESWSPSRASPSALFECTAEGVQAASACTVQGHHSALGHCKASPYDSGS